MPSIFKISLSCLWLLSAAVTLSAQDDLPYTVNDEKPAFYRDVSEACNKDVVFTITEQMPTYEGGVEQLEQDLNAALALDKRTKAKVVVFFTVNCEGKLFGVRLREEDEQEALAMRVADELLQLQNWKPARQREQLVDCFQILAFKIRREKMKLDE